MTSVYTMQFGFIALWSIVWPLIPLACLVNNWFEVRTDSVKICTSRRRPIPHRADSIGPWLDNISFLAWLGSLTSHTLICLFRGEGKAEFNTTSVVHTLLALFIAEHGYWIVDRFVGTAMERFKTTGEINVMREDYMLRRRQFQDMSMVEGMKLPQVQSDASLFNVDDKVGSGGRVLGNFWKGKDVQVSVDEGKEMLCRKWSRRKTQ